MRVTAIIAFTLVGLMFLLKECGNSNLEKREYGTFPEHETHELKDRSLKDRDKEIALASYSGEEEEEIVPSSVEGIEKIEATSEQKVVEGVERVEAKKLVKVEADLPKVELVQEVESVLGQAVESKAVMAPMSAISQTQIKEREDETRIIELERMLEEKSREEQIAQREIDELREKRDSLEKEITKILTEQEGLYNKYTEELDQRKQELDRLNVKYKALETNLTNEIEKQNREFELLSQKYKKLESSIATEQEKKQMLVDENSVLKSQIDELTKAKEALNQKYMDQVKRLKALEASISKYKSMEVNLTAEIESKQADNQALKSEVAKLLSTSKEMADRASPEQKEKDQRIELLTLQISQLEENLTVKVANEKRLLEENQQLKSKIDELNGQIQNINNKAKLE